MKQKIRQENAGTMTVFTASPASPRDSRCQGLARHLQPEMESVSSWQDLQYITNQRGQLPGVDRTANTFSRLVSGVDKISDTPSSAKGLGRQQ